MSNSSRSLQVSLTNIKRVKQSLQPMGFARQRDLAEHLQLSLSTVSNYLNGRPVDFLNFLEISEALGQDWRDIKEDESNQDILEKPIIPEVYPYYITREPVEERCYETILQPGSLLRIKASKRMGKTLLIDRILAQAAKNNYHTISLSLLLTNSSIYYDLEQFLRWFCLVISRKLRLPAQLDDYWEEDLDSILNCTIYFEEYLLPQINRPLVLALDEVDKIFGASFASDFLAMLRYWHEEARSKITWQKLRLIIAHATEVYVEIDINQSPFNVGIPIKLPEFTAQQIQELAQQQGVVWDSSKIQQLMSLLGGHPYRVQRAIYCLKNNEYSFEEMLQTAPKDSGIYSSHLRGYLLNLREKYPELLPAMKQVVQASEPVQLETKLAFQLQSLGLVIFEGNKVKPRCNLYTNYFREHLV